MPRSITLRKPRSVISGLNAGQSRHPDPKSKDGGGGWEVAGWLID